MLKPELCEALQNGEFWEKHLVNFPHEKAERLIGTYEIEDVIDVLAVLKIGAEDVDVDIARSSTLTLALVAIGLRTLLKKWRDENA